MWSHERERNEPFAFSIVCRRHYVENYVIHFIWKTLLLTFSFFLSFSCFFFSTSSSYFAALKSRWRESALLWNEKLKTHETEKSKKKMKKKEKRVVRFIAHSLRAFYVILEHFVESRCWFFYLSFMFIQKFLHEIYDGKSCLKSFSSGLFSSSRSYRSLEFICVHVS